MKFQGAQEATEKANERRVCARCCSFGSVSGRDNERSEKRSWHWAWGEAQLSHSVHIILKKGGEAKGGFLNGS